MRSDTGVIYKGYQSDAARTHGVGEITEDARLLIERTRQSFFEGIKFAKAGNHLNDGFIKPKLHYSGLITEFSFQSFIFAGASGDGAGLPIINDWRKNSNGKQKNAPRSSYNLCRCSAGLSHRLGNGERTGVRSVFFELGLRRRADHRGCCKLRGHVLLLYGLHLCRTPRNDRPCQCV